jgi:hypothetical protein
MSSVRSTAQDVLRNGAGRRREIVCPRCHWDCVRPARRRQILDRIARLVFLCPFRCRSCRKRFYRFRPFISKTVSGAFSAKLA